MSEKDHTHMSVEQMERQLRERLQGHGVRPPEQLWTNIENGLKGSGGAGATSAGGSLAAWIGGGLLISALVTGTWYWMGGSTSYAPQEPHSELIEAGEMLLANNGPGHNTGSPGTGESLSPESFNESQGRKWADSFRVVSVEIERAPLHGSLEYDKAGLKFSYVPFKDFFGPDSFSYRKVYQDNSRSHPLLIRVYIEPEVFVKARFSSTPISGKSIQFTQLSKVESVDPSINRPDSQKWDFGDGMVSTDRDPRHQYVKDGDYTVCLTTYARGQAGTTCQDLSLLKGNSVQITGSARGKSNQKLEIEADRDGKMSRSLVIPANLDLPDLRFILRTSGKGIIDTTGSQGAPSSFNNQPVKKK